MTDYLTLPEAEAGRHTRYEAAPVTMRAVRGVMLEMQKLIDAGEESISRALDKAGANTDNGDTYICRYELRLAVGRRLAKSASNINKQGGKATASNTVARSLKVMDATRQMVTAGQLEFVA